MNPVLLGRCTARSIEHTLIIYHYTKLSKIARLKIGKTDFQTAVLWPATAQSAVRFL